MKKTPKSKKLAVYSIPGLPRSPEHVARWINVQTPEQVFDIVAEKWGITPATLKSRSRQGKVPIARHAAFFIIRERFKLTYQETAEVIGRGNHTSIRHSCKVFQDLWATDKEVRKKMSELL